MQNFQQVSEREVLTIVLRASEWKRAAIAGVLRHSQLWVNLKQFFLCGHQQVGVGLILQRRDNVSEVSSIGAVFDVVKVNLKEFHTKTTHNHHRAWKESKSKNADLAQLDFLFAERVEHDLDA